MGGTVCIMHGGSAPQVKMAAEERLKALADPAITRLEYLIDHGDSDAVRLGAVKDALDRAGFKPVDRKQLGSDPDNPLQILVDMVSDRA